MGRRRCPLPSLLLPTRQREAPVLSRSTSLSSRQHFKLQGLQSPRSHPGASQRAPAPLTTCNYCREHHTAVASAGAVKTGEKCKQRGGLDVPLTLLANYSCLWSAIGCLDGGKWVWSETSLRSNYSKSNFVWLCFPFIPSLQKHIFVQDWKYKAPYLFVVDKRLIYQSVEYYKTTKNKHFWRRHSLFSATEKCSSACKVLSGHT